MPARKKIVHFITDLDVGGTELMLVRLILYLTPYFDIHVVCAKGHGRAGALLEVQGIPVTYLNLRHWFDVGIIYRFYHLVRTVKPDILITHLIHADIFGRIFGKLCGIKIVMCSQHGSLLQWEFLRTLDRLTTPLVTLYIVQTNVARHDLSRRLRIPRQRFAVIPNSVPPHHPPRSELTPVRQTEPDNLRIICVSRLRRRKGHEYLLAAFEQLYHQNQHLSLLLVGDGEREAALRQHTQSYQSRTHIHFLGDRPDVPTLLDSADIFVLPSLAEGMSNALLEAMAAGLPCVVTDIAVNREVVVADKTGILVPTRDSPGLATAIGKLISNPQLRQQLGQNAREYVQQHHAPAVIAQQWHAVLSGIV